MISRQNRNLFYAVPACHLRQLDYSHRDKTLSCTVKGSEYKANNVEASSVEELKILLSNDLGTVLFISLKVHLSSILPSTADVSASRLRVSDWQVGELTSESSVDWSVTVFGKNPPWLTCTRY